MERPAQPSRRRVTRLTRARAACVALLMVLTLEMPDRLLVLITCKPAEPSEHEPKPAQWR